MTPDHDQEAWLRAAVARSRDAHPASQAPVDRILTAARARRKRRRVAAAVASAACVLGLGLAVPFLKPPPDAAGAADRPSPLPARSTAPTPAPVPSTLSARVAEGTTDGHRWSVALEFHRALPEDYGPPTPPGSTTAPDASLLCRRMVIGGVRIDHQGGPWSDCQPVTGVQDPRASGEMGLWGLHEKGLSGTRLLVSNPEAAVAYGVVSLSDGTQVKAATITVPGTVYRAWAAAVPDGRTITAVDQYDAHHRRISHDTDFH